MENQLIIYHFLNTETDKDIFIISLEKLSAPEIEDITPYNSVLYGIVETEVLSGDASSILTNVELTRK